MLFLFISIPTAKAAWLTNWSYRKSHVIIGVPGSGTNYPINVTCYYGSGTDANRSVYLDSKCNEDFGDVRFTDDDQTTQLDYWVQEKTNSSSALIWVEIQDNLNANATIYIYYGNLVATYPYGNDQAEMDATFSFADHFYGSALNSTKWKLNNSPTIVVSGSKVNVTSSSNAWRSIVANQTMFGAYNYSFIARAALNLNYYSQIGMGEPQTNQYFGGVDDYFGFYWLTTNREWAVTYNDAVVSGYDINGDANYHKYAATWKTGICKFYVDDVFKTNRTSSVPNEASCPIMAVYGTSSKVSCDYMFVYKWILNGPVNAEWGIEEGFGYTVSFYFTDGGIIRRNNVTLANGTQLFYSNNTVVEFELAAIVEGNLTYGFDNYTWNGNYNYSNPHDFNLTVLGNVTVWSYFVELEEGGVIPSSILFVGIVFLALIVGIPVFFAWERDRRR